MTKEYLTQEHKDALEAELHEISTVTRKRIVTAIEHAKALGDLSENAEYHLAREEQGRLEERIATIEYMLKHAEVITHTNNGVVSIGSVVIIQKEGESNTRTFTIGGSEENDMLSGKISYKSPLGSVLMGKKVGDAVTVTTPKGEVTYTINNVD